MDVNPLSETYGQTRQETLSSQPVCENYFPNMVLVSSDGENNVYRDNNEYSFTYNTIVEIAIGDTTAKQVEVARVCEQVLYNEVQYGNNGYVVVTYVDCNPNSDTYRTFVDSRVESFECPLPNKAPTFNVVKSCVQKEYTPGGAMGNDGQVREQLIDVNPYSDTYNQVVSDRTFSSDECKTPSASPKWARKCEYCVSQGGQLTGYKKRILVDVNIYSPTYLSELTVEDYDDSCL